MANPSRAGSDPLAHAMEWGLIALVILAPLPFGAVNSFGRACLELVALILGLLWIIRSRSHPMPLPAKLAHAGIIGLVLLALLQIIPLGERFVRVLAPRAVEIHRMTQPPPAIAAAESNLIGLDPTSFDQPVTLSVDPNATASALRTGSAIVLFFFVATCVASVRGVRKIVTALLISASFQGLYGILVLASGYNKIWHITKLHYLDAATGTYINKNHFACFVAMSLACGMALIISRHKRRKSTRSGHFLVRLFSGYNSRSLLLCLLLVIGLAGLLLSLSRSGIALGLMALLTVIIAAAKFKRLAPRIAIAALLLSLAAIPLIQLGAGSLADRYARSAAHWSLDGGRPTVWQDTLQMATAFPLFGSGYGTFSTAYPLYRSPEVRHFYKHAHNDLFQSFAEGGVLGICLSAILLIPLLGTLALSIKGDKGTLAVGIAVGLAVFLLHSLIDFNLHIPSNAAVAALLAGALQGLPWKTGT